MNLREKILRVAENLFMQQGYQATSTRQIAEAVGITQPNLYYHFKGKEAIYYEVMVSLAQEVSGKLNQTVEDTSLTISEKILNMFLFLRSRHRINFYMMMHDIQHTVSEDTSKKLYLLWRKNYKEPFLDLFRRSDSNLRSDVDPEFVTSQLLVLMAAHLDSPEKEDKMPEAIDLFLFGALDNGPIAK